MVNQNIVLKAVMDCGTDDFRLLDGIGYDLDSIIEGMREDGIWPTMNSILSQVFAEGARDMEQRVNDRICELDAIQNERELDSDEETELEILGTLSPQEDIEWSCNCLDSHIWFQNNGQIYCEYLAEAIDAVEDSMGFSFVGS